MIRSTLGSLEKLPKRTQIGSRIQVPKNTKSFRGRFSVLNNFGGGGSIHSHFPITPWNSANITVNHLMLGRWVDSPQRGDRNPPSQSIPALKGDDGQLVRICGTVTRAGPVKAGMLWKSWRSEWRRGTSHFPKVSFVDVHGILFSFVGVCLFFFSLHFCNLGYSYSNMILQPDFVRNRNLPCFFCCGQPQSLSLKKFRKREKTPTTVAVCLWLDLSQVTSHDGSLEMVCRVFLAVHVAQTQRCSG